MAKIKVHELAKETGKASKEILDILEKNGIEGKTASSGLEENEEAVVRKAIAPKVKKAEEAAPAAARGAAAPKARPEGRPERPAGAAPEGARRAPAVDKDGRPVVRRPRPEGAPEGEKPKKKRPIMVINRQNMSSGGQGGRPAPSNRPKPGEPRRGDRPRTQEGRPPRREHQQEDRSRGLIRPTGMVSARTQRRSDYEVAEEKRNQQIAEEERLERARLAEQQAAQEAAAKAAAEEKQPETAPVEAAPVETAPAAAEVPAEPAATAEPEAAPEKKTPAKNTRPEGAKTPSRERPVGPVIMGREESAVARDRQKKGGANRAEGGRDDKNREGRRGEGRNANRPGERRTGDKNRAQTGGAEGGRNAGRGRGARPGADRNAQAGPVDRSGKTGAATNRGNDKNKRRKDNAADRSGGRHQEQIVNLEKNGGKKTGHPQNKPAERNLEEVLAITVPEHLTIHELADLMKVQPSAVIKKLFLSGKVVTMNQEIDYAAAEEIALEFNCVCEPEEKVDVIAELLAEDEESEEDMITRPPVVCVMGHVDHGKTSLLDAIRHTRVTDREAGGITQHIGAYMVEINGQKITFLDTPGHEAFTAMRMRGANSTDIAILVVAADDGVMPQTIEAINHAKAAGVEIMVAINKIDKPGANLDRVKQELAEHGLLSEDWGGSTVCVPVSAKTGEGIDNLLEMVLLTAEVLELKANPNRKARGLVIEAKLDKGRGVLATMLVQKGTLHVGDPIACGASFGKVRAMLDDTGKRVKSAGPSMPVEILGLSEVPNAGETIMALESEKEARSFAATFVSEGKNRLIEETRARTNLEDIFSQIQAGNLKELDIVVKADVQGSVEAVRQSLEKLSNDEVVVKVIHGGVGAINESDVVLASASNAIIIGFNVKPDAVAKQTAETEGVDLRLYKVIYNAIEDVENAMKGMLEPIYEERVIGHAMVRQIFKASGVGSIAGSYVTDGVIERGCKVRVLRRDELIFEGDLASLKRFKDDAKEVRSGYECGIVIDGFSEIAEDDVVEAYKMVEVPRS